MNRAAAKESGKGITSQMQKILDYIEENGKITDLEIQELLGLKKTRAFTLAKQMRFVVRYVYIILKMGKLYYVSDIS